MKKRRILLALLALALALTTALPAAMAYFTTNARANGTRTLELGGTTTIEEIMAGWQKQVTISADDDSQPMWVRARAYPMDRVSNIESEIEGAWVYGGDKDGWWYFTTPLANPAEDGVSMAATSKLLVTVDPVKVDEVGQIPDGFDVTVVYESAPVLYDTDGTRLDYTNAKVWSSTTTTTPGGN